MSDETINLLFRKKDVQKIAEFCTKNNIPVVVAEEKINLGELLGEILQSPVVEKALTVVDHHLERKHHLKMSEEFFQDANVIDAEENEDEDEEGRDGEPEEEVEDG